MATIHPIDPKTLQQWLTANEAILIDVREPVEYKSCHIATARNMPLATISIEKIAAAKHGNKKLVFQCKLGRRSMTACEKLQANNMSQDVWNLEGGINAWKQANLPTVSTNNK